MDGLKKKSINQFKRSYIYYENQIIVAMDMEIPDGMKLISKTRTSEQIYGYKIGSHGQKSRR